MKQIQLIEYLNHNNQKKIRIKAKCKILLLFIISTSILTGCDFLNLMEPVSDNAIVTLSVSENTERFQTITPDITNGISYKISFLSGPESKDSVNYTGSDFPLDIELALGKWTVQVEAIKNEMTFASQSREIEIVQGTNFLNFELSPVFSGEGKITLAISWPETQNIASVIAEFKKLDSGDTDSSELTISENSAAGTLSDLPGGDYSLILYLKDSNGKTVALDDGIARVYAKLTTDVSLKFEDNYFNGKPLAPVDLTASNSGSNIVLNWTDKAWNEESIAIERKLSSDSFYTRIVSLPPDTTSYTDSSINADTEYNYQVKSINRYGESDPCAPVTIKSEANETPDGNIIYVSKSGNVNNSGNSWSNAMLYLEDAMELARNRAGSENPVQIWIAEGIYHPTGKPSVEFAVTRSDAIPEGPDENRSKHFMMTDYIYLYGGFAGTETRLEDRNASTHPVILSGDLSENDSDSNGDSILDDNRSDNVYHVFYQPQALKANASLIDSVTISGGQADYSDDSQKDASGGGIYGASGISDLKNVILKQNYSSIYGAGIYLNSNTDSSGIIVEGCTFQYNLSSNIGGAIYSKDSTLTLTNSIFEGNTSNSDGGALYIGGGISIINNCEFNSNKASQNGGAAYIYEKNNLTMKDSSFSLNEAHDGGALYLLNLSNDGFLEGESDFIFNCYFTGNSAISEGSGGAIISFGNYKIVNSVFTSNSAEGSGGAIAHSQYEGDNGILYLYNTVFDQNEAVSSGSAIISHSAVKMANFIFYQNAEANSVLYIGNDGQTSRTMLQNGTIAGNISNEGITLINDSGVSSNVMENILFAGNTTGDGNITGFNNSGIYEAEIEGKTLEDMFTNYNNPVSSKDGWFDSSCGLVPRSQASIGEAGFYSESDFDGTDMNLNGSNTDSFQTLGDITGSGPWSNAQAGAYNVQAIPF